uniref:Uncharacterized protein n=1 Tax=Arundo donax TaxID=35708 RepID=A0A0A8YYR4_ARUDO
MAAWRAGAPCRTRGRRCPFAWGRRSGGWDPASVVVVSNDSGITEIIRCKNMYGDVHRTRDVAVNMAG